MESLVSTEFPSQSSDAYLTTSSHCRQKLDSYFLSPPFPSTTFLQSRLSQSRMLSASGSSMEDPLTHVLAPPPNESQHDKENRIRAEQEAKKRSDAIDEEINRERNARKNSRPVKVLLLGECSVHSRLHLDRRPPYHATGQSESGVLCVPNVSPQLAQPSASMRHRKVDNAQE